jgi:acyl-CoA thioesterase-2
MSNPVEQLIELLDLESIEVNLFRGRSPNDRWQRVFGGQVLGQALVAATRTVDDERIAHSLHAYFIRPGDPKVPILYEVDRARDGRSFATRRVVAIQHGRPIFSMSVSFHVQEEGFFNHTTPMPDVPPPEELVSENKLAEKIIDQLPDFIAGWLSIARPVELRPVNPRNHLKPEVGEPVQHVWVKATDPIPDDFALHQCILAYASDMTLLDTSLLAHGIGPMSEGIQMASLDHAMWFHKPFRADEWLLYSQDSPIASNSRGFNRGSLYTRDGDLVVSVAQEGLIRKRKEK